MLKERIAVAFKTFVLLGAVAAVVIGALPKQVVASESDPCPKAGCVCVDNGTTKWYEGCGEAELE
jgi:hypothetical protein